MFFRFTTFNDLLFFRIGNDSKTHTKTAFFVTGAQLLPRWHASSGHGNSRKANPILDANTVDFYGTTSYGALV